MTPGLLLGSLLWMLPEPPPLPDGVTARLGSERLRHPWYTKQVAFDASGALVTGAGFTVWSWDPWTGQPQGVLTPPPRVFFNEIVNDFALSPVGDVAVAGASGLYLRRGDEWARLEEGHFEAVDFAPGGGALAAIGPEGGFVRALATGDQVALSKLPDDPKAVALGEGAVFVGGWDTAGAWSAETGRPLWSAEANPSAATTALSPDGRRVAFETWGGLEIRELATGARVAECSAYSLYSAAFGPDGRRLYLGGSDGEIWTCSAEGGWAAEYFVWPEPDAFPDAGIPGDTAAVNGLAVSPDGRLVASIHSDHTARLWSAGAAVPLFVDDGHTRDVSASALSPDGSIAATAGDDGTIRLWSLPSGAPLRTLRGHESFVTDLAFLPDGSLVSTSYDKHAMRWQPGESSPVAGVELTSPAGLHPSPDAVAVGPAGEVIVGGIGGILASVTFVDGSFDEGTVTPLAGGDYEETVNDLALGPGGALYVGGNDGVLRLRLLQGASAPVAAEVTFPDHELAGPVAAADYAPRRGMLSPPDVEAVAVSPDGSRVAACSTHRVGVWDAGLETLYSVVETAGCADLLFLPDGRLVTAERDAWRVRDPTTGAATIERTEHRGAILTLSADGERVLTAGEGTAALVGPIPEAGSP